MHIQFDATLYDSFTAGSESCQVSFQGGNEIHIRTSEGVTFAPLTDVKISGRLGNTPRFITLPNGSKLETRDNEAVDLLIRQQSGKFDWIHFLESNKIWILALTLLVMLSGFATYKWIIPWSAEAASPLVPDVVREKMATDTLALIDEWMVEPTTLDESRQQHYRDLFERRLGPFAPDQINIQFRKAPGIGANAFALPDGTLIFTDELLAIVNDEEYLAIAAHEVGHVVEDHGVRGVLASSFFAIIITLITGDAEAISELLIAAPVVMAELSYSRQNETEADNFARNMMRQAEIPLPAFATALMKITKAHRDEETKLEANGEKADSQVSSSWSEYLSTHPATQERIQAFKEPQ